MRIFSNADPKEQIKVRLDDKISRYVRATVEDKEDSLKDILGYLVLYYVLIEREKGEI
jgi:hypothetical protein